MANSRVLLVRRFVTEDKLSLVSVKARRCICFWEPEGSLRTSPFLSDAQNVSSPESITCRVSKSLVLPSAGKSQSCSFFGRPLDSGFVSIHLVDDRKHEVIDLAGSGKPESKDGNAAECSFDCANGIVVHEPSRSCFVTELFGHKIRRVSFL